MRLELPHTDGFGLLPRPPSLLNRPTQEPSAMEPSVIQTLALTLGAGWASGINLYATLLVLGLAQALGYASLPPDLAILTPAGDGSPEPETEAG